MCWLKSNRNGLVILLIAALSFLLPFSSYAAEITIGVIMSGDIPYYQEMQSAFMARIAKEGLSAKTEVLVQKPYPDSISLSNAARKLIAAEADVIVTYGAAAAAAVINEKTKIPHVYAAAYEPYISRLKAKNSTGTSVKLSMSSLLRYLRSMTQVTTLGIVYNSNEEDSLYQFREIVKICDQYGIRIEEINLRRHQDAKTRLKTANMDAILITGSSTAHMALPAISEYAHEHKIPSASFLLNRNSHTTVTMSYTPSEQGEKAAEKVIKIVDGTSVEKIRPDMAKEMEIVFNLKEATAMGWKLPMDLVAEATRLIK